MKWISVEDKLPKEAYGIGFSLEVIAISIHEGSLSKSQINICTYDHESKLWQDHWAVEHNPTHWMKLPTPPND